MLKSGLYKFTMGLKSEEERLFKACQEGRVQEVQEILSKSSSPAEHLVNLTSADHKTPLFYAIIARSYQLVRLLLKHGADVNKSSSAFYGRDCSLPNFETCEEPPLVTASRTGCTEILQCLLRNGSDPNRQAQVASSHQMNHREALKETRNCQLFRTPGFLKRHRRPALKLNHSESDLLPGSKISMQQSSVFPRRSDSFNGYFGMSALHNACESCQVENVKLLLSYKTETSAQEGKRHETPLHLAVRCKEPLCSKQCEIIDLLCSHGANVNALSKRRHSPFYLAALYGCAKKVEILLKHGTDPNPSPVFQDSLHVTAEWGGYGSAMHVAAYKGYLPLAVALINNGADINWVNSSGMTPLHLNIAVRNRSNVAALLIFHGALLDNLPPETSKTRSLPTAVQQSLLYSNDGTSLLSTCLSSPRLDCESLAILLVQAGYDLNQDPWLVPYIEFNTGEIPGRTSQHNLALRLRSPVTSPAECRVSQLCKWLRLKQQAVRSLTEICRSFLRRQLAVCGGGKSIVPSVNKLPLPTALKNFLLLKNPSGQNIEDAILNCFQELQKDYSKGLPFTAILQ